MNKIYALILPMAVFISANGFAQYVAPDCGAVEAVIVERYYVADANDAGDTDGGELAEGSVTYRVFIDMKPGYILESVFGNGTHPLTISSTEVFFNNEDRGENTGDAIPANRLGDNTVALDSYLTFNAASNAHLAVMKAEDMDGSIIGGENNDGGSEGVEGGLLVNFTEDMDLALTSADGLMEGAIISSTTGLESNVGVIGIPDLTVFGSENTGNSFFLNSGSWFVLGGTTGPTESNRVLIAQLTTAGTLNLELNFRVGIPDELQCAFSTCHENMDFLFFLTEAEQQPSLANDRLCLLPEVTFTNSIVSTSNANANQPFFEVYPNPASDRVVLAVDPQISGHVNYRLFDMYGRLIAQGWIQQGNGIEVLELDGLAKGMYILSAEYKGQVNSLKLVKR